MRISVAIVNWNTKTLLHNCLGSLEKELNTIDHEIIVADNNSTDGSREMIKRVFPNVILIENTENIGFPEASNQILSKCHGEYLMLLNSDTVVLPRAVKKLMEFLDSHREYGAAGPKIVRPDGSIQFECACNFPTLWGMFCELTQLSKVFSKSPAFGQWRMTHWDHKNSRDVECLLGAAILMRKAILDDIGPLDDHMYVEDDDLCFRIRKAGWKIRYFSIAEVVHQDSASLKRSPRFYHHYQIAWHGLWHFFKKHRNSTQAHVFRLMTFVCSMVGVLLFFSASWLLLLDKERSLSLRDKGKKAWAVFLWSIIPPKRFKPRY